jgi:hypothetical protein
LEKSRKIKKRETGIFVKIKERETMRKTKDRNDVQIERHKEEKAKYCTVNYKLHTTLKLFNFEDLY